MKAVMYHYVRLFDPNWPFFRFLHFDNFRRQLDFFEAKYSFANRDEWREYVSGNLPCGNEKFFSQKLVLTFDDSLSCHADYVVPELERRGLWGFFYVPTKPYTHGELLDVHRIHLLAGAIDGKLLYKELSDIVTDDMLDDGRREEFLRFTYRKQRNFSGVGEFKRALNFLISCGVRSSVIDSIAKKFDYKFPSSGFYIPEEKLRQMERAGHIIGSHSVNHPVMSKLSYEQQLSEIRDSFDTLASIVQLEERTYCHPYGEFYSYDSDTVDILNSLNVSYSFCVDSREIRKEDYQSGLQALPRYNCNEFAFGEAS